MHVPQKGSCNEISGQGKSSNISTNDLPFPKISKKFYRRVGNVAIELQPNKHFPTSPSNATNDLPFPVLYRGFYKKIDPLKLISEESGSAERPQEEHSFPCLSRGWFKRRVLVQKIQDSRFKTLFSLTFY